jgi:hypothetical protein
VDLVKFEFQGHKNIAKLDGSTATSWETFVCGHCGTKVAGAVAAIYSYKLENIQRRIKWLLCTNCGEGSSMTDDKLYPGAVFGPAIEGLPDDVKDAYQEARNCLSVNAFTACDLICRKILMHVGVEKGAEEGKTFAFYIDHLESQGYITPPMKRWVDIIRQHGNKATHKLEPSDRTRAEGTLMFTAEMLRLIYEMDHLANQYTM